MDSETTNPLLAQRQVTRSIRSMRKRARMGLEEAAPLLDLSRSTLSRMEAGQTRVTVHVARSMMDLYDEYSPSLLDNVRAARARGWWRDHGFGACDYIGWESGASHVREVAISRIPDLLQTENYAQALITDSQDAENTLTVLKIRQHRLATAPSPLRLSVVLDESALHNKIGEPAVMRAQLAHLRECASWPTVSLRILPATAAAHINANSFRLLEFDQTDEPPIAFADTVFGTTREDQQQKTTQARHCFNKVYQTALPLVGAVAECSAV